MLIDFCSDPVHAHKRAFCAVRAILMRLPVTKGNLNANNAVSVLIVHTEPMQRCRQPCSHWHSLHQLGLCDFVFAAAQQLPQILKRALVTAVQQCLFSCAQKSFCKQWRDTAELQ